MRRHKLDESLLGPGRLTPRGGLRRRGWSRSPESLSLKLSGDQLTERRARTATPRLLCAVHCTNEPLKQLREGLFIDRSRAAWKSRRNPIGRGKSSLPCHFLQISVEFVRQFNNPAHRASLE